MTAACELPAGAFPVVFLEGDREIPLCIVTLDSSLAFDNLQATIGHRFGVSPNQIFLHLVRRDTKKKIMSIDKGSDFCAISGERDCFVLALLKRSRRSRGRRARVSSVAAPTILLRRPNGKPSSDHVFFSPDDGSEAFRSVLSNTEGLQHLQFQRNRYLTSSAVEPYEPMIFEGSYYGGVGNDGEVKALPCKVCADSDRPPPFHWCVNDRITFGFRSKVGPVERPSKVQTL